MKEMLKLYASYNTWANQKILDLICSLPVEHHQKEIASSFSSLHATILHMWNAESAWWQRIKLQERLVFPADDFKGDTKDASSGLLHQSKQWDEWVSNASEISLDHVVHYQTTKKEQFKQPTWQIILHVFNHSTYHRGQLVTLLRQLGVDKIPQTDFILWARSRK